jgi:hypothetical protein
MAFCYDYLCSRLRAAKLAKPLQWPYGQQIMTRRDPTASIALSLGLVAALLALCLRLMAPVGWMPVASGNGVMFTLCSGSGEQQVTFGKDGKPSTPDNGASHGGPCAFSGIGTPALPDLPPSVALQIFAIFIALGLAATQRPRLAAVAWLRPPLRGPPLRA